MPSRLRVVRVGIRLLTAVALVGASTASPAKAATFPPRAHAAKLDTAVFAGGCFWGVQAVFARVKGVESAISGYAGGHVPNPTYEEVSTGTTGNAESVRVIFNPAIVSYDQLLAVFFTVAHNPTELNFQGPDHGTQYRSAVFFRDTAQRHAARAYIAGLTSRHAFDRPIVTEVTPLNRFYPAEAYHQGYFDSHPDQPYIVINDKPKVEHLQKMFPKLYVAN